MVGFLRVDEARRWPFVFTGPLLHLLATVSPAGLRVGGFPAPSLAAEVDDQPRLTFFDRVAFQALHRFSRGELVHPKAVVFMSGVPGAGKSTIIDQRYRPRATASTVVLDLDAELATHPRYDPKDPDKLYFEGGTASYDWADQRVEARFAEALSDPKVRRIVIDGTGTNTERQMRRMRAARDAGWFVKVLYVHIPVETAVRRAAVRARPIKAERIYSYQGRIGDALEQMAYLADEFEVFDAPSHDPAHVLMREGFVDQSRTLVAAEAEAKRRAQMSRIAQIRQARPA